MLYSKLKFRFNVHLCKQVEVLFRQTDVAERAFKYLESIE